MKTKVNWGIIGTGRIAKEFAKDLATVTNANCYAVASRSHEKAVDFTEEFHFEKSYGSYEALVKDPNVDAVYIAVPHTFHYECTKLCLQHGKAVLCEKPFAMNTEQVAEMIALAQEKDLLLMEALWTYFLPHYQYVLNLVKEQKFGTIQSLTADFGFVAQKDPNARLLNKSLGGGSLLDIGIYPVFVALTLLGMPNKIEAKATFFETGADSECYVTFHYNNEVKAHLKSTLLEDTATEAIIACEEGNIKINSKFYEPSTVTLAPKQGKEEVIDFGGYTSIGYNYEAAHFGDLFLKGEKESPIMNFDTSQQLITLLDSIRKEIQLEY